MNTFKNNEKAGVIYVMEKASKRGFYYGNKNWANLGQGAPELGSILTSPQRISKVSINQINHGYAPVAGLKKLREKVAHLYNELFRKNRSSLLKYQNVSIGGGGRLILSRIFASMNRINVGYFLPDYASYEGILSAFNNLNPIPFELKAQKNFNLPLNELEKFLEKNNIKALLLSNPTNPTGNLIKGEKLKNLVNIARKLNCYLILDEFYFNYIFDENGTKYVSSQQFIKNVNKDPVVIISGLTKPWRYPGWRICWAIGPNQVIDQISSTGSFLDGGANNPLQKKAIELINLSTFKKESTAIRDHFSKKRNFLIENLKNLGFKIDNKPKGAFYIWANLENLPKPLNDGMKFFEKGLCHNVIVVPGIFFDLNPHSKRKIKNFENYIRISYSSDMKTIKKGLNSFKEMIDNFSKK